MNRRQFVWAGLFAGAATMAGSLGRATQAAETAPDAGGEDADIEYVPPRRGAPVVRVSGGTRSQGIGDLDLQVLAPLETGYTANPAPVLYWYQAVATALPIEFVVIGADAAEPLMVKTLSGGAPAGINAISLAEGPARLEPNVEYQWSISVIVDADKPSTNPVSLGGIALAKAPQDLQGPGQDGAALALARAQARHGLFYDAVSTLSLGLKERPADGALRTARASLLRAVGLGSPADFDLKRGRTA